VAGEAKPGQALKCAGNRGRPPAPSGKPEGRPEEGQVDLEPVRLMGESLGQELGADQAGRADERQVVAAAVGAVRLVAKGVDHGVSEHLDPEPLAEATGILAVGLW